MSIRTLLIAPLAIVLALAFAGRQIDLFDATSSPFAETSAMAAAPEGTPTYVSEIGTALTVPPRAPASLPSSGSGGPSSAHLPLLAGLVLVAGGVGLIQAARSLGRGRGA